MILALAERQVLLVALSALLLSACTTPIPETIASLPIREERSYSIPVPQEWIGQSSGQHSFMQGDGGCSSFADKEKSIELARLCASEGAWDNVSARARQLVIAAGPSKKHTSKTTAGGARYHIFSDDDQGVDSLILEGKSNLLRIDIRTPPPDNQYVADTLISLFDSVRWREHAASRQTYKVASSDPLAAIYAGPIIDRTLCESVHAADVKQIRLLTHGKKLDLFGACSTQGPSFMDLVVAFHEDAWQQVLPLISEDQRPKLLNARLVAQLNMLPRSKEYQSKHVAKIGRLIDEGALPLDRNDSIEWGQVGALLLAPRQYGFEFARESSELMMRILDRLPERDGNKVTRLGDYFPSMLLEKNERYAPVPEALRLDVLSRLKSKYGQVVFWPGTSAVRELLPVASDEVLKAVARLEPVALGDADTIALAIARNKLAMLELDLEKQIQAMSQAKYRRVIDAAREKARATGDSALLGNLLRLRKPETE